MPIPLEIVRNRYDFCLKSDVKRVERDIGQNLGDISCVLEAEDVSGKYSRPIVFMTSGVYNPKVEELYKVSCMPAICGNVEDVSESISRKGKEKMELKRTRQEIEADLEQLVEMVRKGSYYAVLLDVSRMSIYYKGEEHHLYDGFLKNLARESRRTDMGKVYVFGTDKNEAGKKALRTYLKKMSKNIWCDDQKNILWVQWYLKHMLWKDDGLREESSQKINSINLWITRNINRFGRKKGSIDL